MHAIRNGGMRVQQRRKDYYPVLARPVQGVSARQAAGVQLNLECAKQVHYNRITRVAITLLEKTNSSGRPWAVCKIVNDQLLALW